MECLFPGWVCIHFVYRFGITLGDFEAQINKPTITYPVLGLVCSRWIKEKKRLAIFLPYLWFLRNEYRAHISSLHLIYIYIYIYIYYSIIWRPNIRKGLTTKFISVPYSRFSVPCQICGFLVAWGIFQKGFVKKKIMIKENNFICRGGVKFFTRGA